MKFQSDAELVTQCLEGDRSAFWQLAEKHKGSVYALAYSKLLNWSDAEDVTHEVLLRAYDRLGQVKFPDHFRAWILRITSRCAKDYLRSSQKEKPMDVSELLREKASFMLEQDRFEWKEDMERIVTQALEALPEDLRTPVVMFYMEDVSHRQIAHSLGISPRNVEVRIRRARQHLRDYFRRFGLEEDCHELLHAHCTAYPLAPDFLSRLMQSIRQLPIPSIPSSQFPVTRWLPYVFAGGTMILGFFAGQRSFNPTDFALPSPSGHPTIVLLEETGTPVRLEIRLQGILGYSRYGHRTIPLPDGGVLVAKGTGMENRDLANCEIYDPQSASFEMVASFQQTHGVGFTATVLSNGDVLFAGGRREMQYISLAEVLDSDRHQYVPVGELNHRRADHTATLLQDGQVLIAGGASSGNYFAHTTAELYDPRTRSFRLLPTPMYSRRQLHTATLLDDGRVLIVGGVEGTGDGYAGPALQASELYDPQTRQFHETGSLNVSRHLHTATSLQDGRVLILGGSSSSITGGQVRSTAELYDPRTGQFTLAGMMRYPREGHTATLLPDGSVLIVGGRYCDPRGVHYVSEIERFDPATCQFVIVGELNFPRYHHTATFTQDGDILVIGGLSEADTPVGQVELVRVVEEGI